MKLARYFTSHPHRYVLFCFLSSKPLIKFSSPCHKRSLPNLLLEYQESLQVL
nr:MAG TPA: hypothetical protein [Caudoviricetes sp.]